ncbi:SCO2322 family protein [Streptomyces sp. NPDC006654]|uniref:SCO2322 family protein n=1 Tax=unclassified Streptomyces TaxID=2593676 RepID=UPI00341161E4
MTAARRAAPLLLAVLLLAAWGSAGRAAAAGYRYWSFWERDGGRWTYATQGPSTAQPADGAVEGFRFAVSEDSGDASQPRGTADFRTICAGTDAVRGKKRVALVVDFGTPADAPSGERPPAGRTACAVVPAAATSAEALAAVAKPLRYDTNALLCAIAGYPAKGCGEQVTTGSGGSGRSAGSGGTEDGGPSVGLLAGAGVVVVLAAGAFWQARRRRDA